MGCTPSCNPNRLGRSQRIDVRPQSRQLGGQGYVHPLDALRRSSDELDVPTVGKHAIEPRELQKTPLQQPAQIARTFPLEKPTANDLSQNLQKLDHDLQTAEIPELSEMAEDKTGISGKKSISPAPSDTIESISQRKASRSQKEFSWRKASVGQKRVSVVTPKGSQWRAPLRASVGNSWPTSSTPPLATESGTGRPSVVAVRKSAVQVNTLDFPLETLEAVLPPVTMTTVARKVSIQQSQSPEVREQKLSFTKPMRAEERLQSAGDLLPVIPPVGAQARPQPQQAPPLTIETNLEVENVSQSSSNVSVVLRVPSQKRQLSLTKQSIISRTRQIDSAPVSRHTTPSPHALSFQPLLHMAKSDGLVDGSSHTRRGSKLKKNKRRKGSRNRHVSISPAIEILEEIPSVKSSTTNSVPYLEPLGYGACVRPLKKLNPVEVVLQSDGVGMTNVSPSINPDMAETVAVSSYVTPDQTTHMIDEMVRDGMTKAPSVDDDRDIAYQAQLYHAPIHTTEDTNGPQRPLVSRPIERARVSTTVMGAMSGVESAVDTGPQSIHVIEPLEIVEKCHAAVITDVPGLLIQHGEKMGSVFGTDTAELVPPPQLLGEDKSAEMCVRTLKYKLPLEETVTLSPPEGVEIVSVQATSTVDLVDPSQLQWTQLLGELKSSERCVRTLKLRTSLEKVESLHTPPTVTLTPTRVTDERAGPLNLRPAQAIRQNSTRRHTTPTPVRMNLSTMSNQPSASSTLSNQPSASSTLSNQPSASSTQSKRSGGGGGPMFRRHTIIQVKPASTEAVPTQSQDIFNIAKSPTAPQLRNVKSPQNFKSPKQFPNSPVPSPAKSALAPRTPTPSQNGRKTPSGRSVSKVQSISKQIFGPGSDRHSPSGL